MRQNTPTFLAVVLLLGVSSIAATPVQADGDAKNLVVLDEEVFNIFVGFSGFGESDFVPVAALFDRFGAGPFSQILSDVARDLFNGPADIADTTFVASVGDNGEVQTAFNPDPFFVFNTTFTNPTTEPVDISYTFLLPVLPVVGPTEVVSQLSFDLIDANGDGSASITHNPLNPLDPLDPSDTAIQRVGLTDSQDGPFGRFSDIGFSVGTEITTLGETLFAPAITAGPEAAVAFDSLTVFGRFTLSAGDSVTVTGLGGLVEEGGFLPTLASFNFDNFPSTAIPEPSSALLLLLGLATGLGRLRNRQRA